MCENLRVTIDWMKKDFKNGLLDLICKYGYKNVYPHKLIRTRNPLALKNNTREIDSRFSTYELHSGLRSMLLQNCPVTCNTY